MDVIFQVDTVPQKRGMAKFATHFLLPTTVTVSVHCDLEHRGGVYHILSGKRDHEKGIRACKLRDKYGKSKVWTLPKLKTLFTIHAIIPPLMVVTRKSDGMLGTVLYQLNPLFVFDFQPAIRVGKLDLELLDDPKDLVQNI